MRTQLIASAACLALVAPAVTSAQTTGPVAVYWVSTETNNGMPGMGGGGMNIMAMMSGDMGPTVSHSMKLQLQSERTGGNRAQHIAAPALGFRSPLPLRPQPRGSEPEQVDYDGAIRLLVYHGCGATVGEPVVIDLSTTRGLQIDGRTVATNITPQNPPSPGAGRTYGEWPNRDGRETLRPEWSLVGSHQVRGEYTPDINFDLGQSQDFMAPVQLSGVETGALSWGAVERAEAYFATVMGARNEQEMVFWSSSAQPIMPGHIPTYLTEGDRARLLRERILLPARTTSCQIPNVVKEAANMAMVRVQAFADDVDIAYPPRPEDRNQPWNLEYVVKVRYASAGTAVLGMDMSEMNGEAADEGESSRGLPVPPSAEDAARAVLRGLGGLRRRN